MSWKRFWRISGEVLFWCLVVAFFVWVGFLRTENEDARGVREVRVVVVDQQERNFVNSEIVLGLIEEDMGDLVGRSIEDLNMWEINWAVESYNFVSHSRAYVDYDNVVTIEVYQRRPVVRVLCSDGNDYYLSEDMHILPIHSSAHINLPIITGALPLPVEKGFVGDLAEPLADLEEEIAMLEGEDRARIEQRRVEQQKMREERQKKYKRESKGLSDEEKQKLRNKNREILRQEAENNRIEDAQYIIPIDQKILAKKKYEENYNFLLKLINFVELTEHTPQWQGEFVQFVALESKQRVESHIFREPHFELIPRRGEYTIEFGTLADAERKLQKLSTFLSAGVVDTRGGRVSVEFDGQVVWKAPKSDKKSNK